MNMAVGFGAVALFFVLIITVLERSHRKTANFTEFAVAGRSFGSWFQTGSFLNTWIPGTFFVAFAGSAAGSGIIGMYTIFYSLLTIMLMYFMADRVFHWGKKFDLKTQADFVGMRYNSRTVRVLSAVIGVVSVFPWVVLGFQSLGLVFSYLSFGVLTTVQGIFVGVVVLGLRQIWTIRMGMRGIVISDMIQGLVAYGLGGIMALGFIVWLLGNGFGFDKLPASFATIPGFGSDLGPLYFFSIVLTGALGAWCWPDIFVRMFTAKSAATVKRSAVKSAPLYLIFCGLLLTMAMLSNSLPGVSEAPDDVWFLVTSHGGPIVLALAGVCVLAATMGNVNAINSAIGTHTSQDIVHVRGATDKQITRTARITIGVTTILAIIGAIATASSTSGLVAIAIISYQGIVQLAPSLYFGIFWRRGTALAAIVGMTVGFAVAGVLQIFYPASIPQLGGVTSGIVGLTINTTLYLGISLVKPTQRSEQERVDELFGQLGGKAAGCVVSASTKHEPLNAK